MKNIDYMAWDENTKTMHKMNGCSTLIEPTNVAIRLGFSLPNFAYKNCIAEKIILLRYTGFNDSEGSKIYDGHLINSFQNNFMPTEVYWDDQLGSWATSNYHSTLALCDSMQKDVKIVKHKFTHIQLLKQNL